MDLIQILGMCLAVFVCVGLSGFTGYLIGSKSITPNFIESEQTGSTSKALSFEEAQKARESSGRDKPSPHDWLKEEDISILQDKVILDIENAKWARFSATYSMDPVLDSTSTGIEIIPKSAEDIHVGDIVSYYSPIANATVIHRVIEVGEDHLGWYAKFKGDNNALEDPGRVRFSQIKRILVAVIY